MDQASGKTEPERKRAPRGAAAVAIAAGVIILVAIALPVDSLLDWGSRWNTVAGFRAHYRAGLRLLQVALVVNALVLAALPWFLSRVSRVRDEPRLERWPMLVLPMITLALTAPTLGTSFQQDEYRCLKEYIRHGPVVILTRSPNADNHVLYSLLAWPFVRILGEGEVPHRLPAWLLTSLAPAFLYATLRRRHDLWTSLAAAGPLSIAFYVFYYGGEGRGYGPMLSAVLALCWLQPRSWWMYVVAGVAAVGFHVFAAAAVVALSARRDLRLLSALGVIGALSFLLYSMMIPQMLLYSRQVAGRDEAVNLLLAWNYVGVLPAWSAIPFALPLLVTSKPGQGTMPLLFSALACAALLVGIVSLSGSAHSPRFYAPAVAILWAAIGHGLAGVRPRRLRFAILLVAILVSTATSLGHHYRLGKRDFRAAAQELRERGATDVAVFHDCRPVEAYLPSVRVTDYPEGEWFLILDRNQTFDMTGYQCEFRLPSTGGEIRGYRRTR